MRVRQISLLLCCIVFLLSESAAAIEEWESEDGEVYFSLVGAERLTGAFFHVPPLANLYPEGDDALAASVTRLMLDGAIGEHVGLETNLFIDISRRPFGVGGQAFSTAGSFESPYRTSYLDWALWQDSAIAGEAGIDRLNVAIKYEPFSITLGRTAINHSVTRIFAPNDFFAPFSATAINTMYKPGVDAVSLGFAPGTLSLVQLTGVLGFDDDDTPAWGQSALLLHARTVVYEVELAALTGKLAERWVAGGSVQASAGQFNIRAEGHIGFPDDEGDFSMTDLDGDGRTRDEVHARLTVGFDTFFNWHNSSLGGAYLYLSDGASDPHRYIERAGRFYPDDQHLFGRHYLGFSAATEIIPVLRPALTGLFNVADPSGMGVLTLAYNISDEADFIAGVIVPFGRRQTEARAQNGGFVPESEYGHVPFNLFMESRFYF